jgi:uncharacterized membrane protein YeaQ/YmgE (transglycosylase-associated protein family)
LDLEVGVLLIQSTWENAMSLVLFLVFGLVVGFIARFLMPGEQRMGLAMTAILGILGSYVGGFLGALVSDSRVTDLNTAGFIGSLLGALLVLFIAGGVQRQRHA